jgi:FkbM family methyltransferase
MWNHPLASKDRRGAMERWLRWQVGSRILHGSMVVPLANDVVMLVDPGMTGATGNIYVGLAEFEDMAFVMHALRRGDRFLDVGANVGVYTLLAAGRGASCVAIEPIPVAYQRLAENVRLNAFGALVRAENIGVAAKPGKLRFTRSLDTVNHVLAATEGDATDAIDVEVSTVDAVVAGATPSVIKIDVEGFETEVLAGATSTLASRELVALIIELNGSGTRYGFDEDALHRRICAQGFAPCTYDPWRRELRELRAHNTVGNTIYVRDRAAVDARIRAAERFRVRGVSV